MTRFRSIVQDVVADALNSTTDNLGPGATWNSTGSGTSTLGVAGIQVSLKTDQNCTVYVDQSPDNLNWDITDAYNYYASIGNFGVTVQAINSYVRVRVKNTGLSATTYLRLQTALCPIVEAVPRVSVLLWLLCLDRVVGRVDGVILFTGIVIYTIVAIIVGGAI